MEVVKFFAKNSRTQTELRDGALKGIAGTTSICHRKCQQKVSAEKIGSVHCNTKEITLRETEILELKFHF